MPVFRFVVDVTTPNDDHDVNQLSQEIGKYVNGVITEQWMEGNATVTYNSGSHEHKSTRRYACEPCSQLAYDGVS